MSPMDKRDRQAYEELRAALEADPSLDEGDVEGALASFLSDCDQEEWEASEEGQGELRRLWGNAAHPTHAQENEP